MYAKKSRFRPWILGLILLVLVSVFMGSTAAKYLLKQEIHASVTFTARLAENLLLQEHKVVREDDGSYTLSTDPTNGNSYDLIPGLDVPKDPYVQVVNKTPIASYLYVEVKQDLNSAITWDIEDSNWELLNDVTGPNGGLVYVYKTKPLTDENCPTDEIFILQNNQIKVSQKLLTADQASAAADTLTFYAYLYEVRKTDGGEVMSPAAVFTAK